MRVFITGASGLIGEAVTAALIARGDAVVAMSRSGRGPRGAEVVTGDPTQAGPWQERLAACDATVHLAGEPVAGRRWSDEHKRRVRESRVAGTRQVVAAGPKILVSASGIDIYPFDESERAYGEDAPTDDGFLAEVCKVWEGEALRAGDAGARVACLRIGLVLGRGGGAMAQLVPVFKRFAGGPLGKGKQWVSWIQVEDVAGVVLRALDDETLRGPINTVAGSVRQAEFSKLLGDILKRPSWLQVPGFVLRVAVGEMAEMLLHGRNVVPAALQRAGYTFKHPTLAAAFAASV